MADVLPKVRARADASSTPGTCSCASGRRRGQRRHDRAAPPRPAPTCFVAGSAVYGADDPARAVALLRDRVRAVTPHRWTDERPRRRCGPASTAEGS